MGFLKFSCAGAGVGLDDFCQSFPAQDTPRCMILFRLPPDNKYMAVTVQSDWLLLAVKADLK